MNDSLYQQLQLSEATAQQLALDFFGIEGKAAFLPGEIDFNYKITTANKAYILKVSRPDAPLDFLHFQDELLRHVAQASPSFRYPMVWRDASGTGIFEYTDAAGRERKVRLLEWIEGPLYAHVHPKTGALWHSLGQRCGQITSCLQGFEHESAKRNFDWNLSDALWVEAYLHLFNDQEAPLIEYFVGRFRAIQPQYRQLRKSVIHNDANDHNIVVSASEQPPQVEAIIDYGDSVYSQTINDLAVALAYGVMDLPQPIEAAKAIVAGYHEEFPLLDDELSVLYIATAMRLVVSVTKSAINKRQEPDNEYLLVSEQSAWALLRQWRDIPEHYAYYCFRSACGMEPCPQFEDFGAYAQHTQWRIEDLIPDASGLIIKHLDLSIASKFVGNFSNYIDSDALDHKISGITEHQPYLFVGGYGEARPIYTTDAFRIPTNQGHEHRTIHLGVDFWTKAQTPLYALEDGEIYGFHHNNHPKDYGPTVIIKHQVGASVFYTLYGHLTLDSLSDKYLGKPVKKGDYIGKIGEYHENGNWSPHLHFQVILDMLGHEQDFIGVASPTQWPVFRSLCPDPNLLFGHPELASKAPKTVEERLHFRKNHLGKSLSLSYSKPLHIARGQMQYLIDAEGQKYLDTVNNVAHVGHEHPRVVEAGQAQMGILNTNTRYLHEEILAFAEELLATLPNELSVVHFVNSGSEANELALRMAKAATGAQDLIALEIGYHGNTQGCIDISSYKFDGKGGKGCPPHTHIVPLPDAFRGMYRGQHTGTQYAQHVAQTIAKLQAEHRPIAGFIAESIVSCGGQIALPEGYLAAAYEHVRAAGGVCIADEVQVGFGRVGKAFWGFELQGVVPDVVTMGKPIGNGHPLAAVVCTRAVADAFANGMEYFNTFGGNPVSCAIGREVLRVIRDEKLQENAYTVGEQLKQQLRQLQAKYPLIGDVRGEGLFLGVELVDAQLKPLTAQTSYLANRMKDFNVLMSVDGPFNNVLKIKPPMCFSSSNADYLIDCLHRVLEEDFMRRI